MKIIFLAPGLSGSQRGYERFVLELAAELRKAGLDAVCWGTSASEGVEAISVPGRTELQAIALDRFRADSLLANLPATALQDWSLYTEDQLFAIPAAARLKALLDQNETVLVYAKWQGGLVDPSGAPTELLKLLAGAHAAGRANLLIHADYVYPPIDSLLWAAQSSFHSLGPWISEQLLQQGMLQSSIIELPMSIAASAYRNVQRYREQARRELNIPEDAFVILSVGSFDTTTPDKRHGYILREITSLPDREDVWWVVAGSRGPAATTWEVDAQRQLGSRFVPLQNVPFAKMPHLYGLANLFTLGGTSETFGLVYLEAQFSGLPIVIHDSKISRHLCAGLSPQYTAISLVDMMRSGAAAAAIAHWKNLLTGDGAAAIRRSLNDFAQTQEKRFAWEFTGTRFAAAFSNLMELLQKNRCGIGMAAAPKANLKTWDEQGHRHALQLFGQGKLREASTLLGRVIGGRETAERWNDWATVRMALKNPLEAEQGFRLALGLDPRHTQAAVNLGAVLISTGRRGEALPFLEQAFSSIDEAQRPAVSQMLDECRASQKSATATLSTNSLGQFLRGIENATENESAIDESLPLVLAMLKAFPETKPTERVLCVGRRALLLGSALKRFAGVHNVLWTSGTAESLKTYEDASLDSIVAVQALEQSSVDPLNLFCEANRLLKNGGKLFLTAPNIASLKSVHSILDGNSPYVQGHLPIIPVHEPPGREYTPEEISVLAKSAGFAVDQLRSQNLFWEPAEKIYSGLVASGYSIGLRGDTILLSGTKESPVRERYPEKLYDLGAIESVDASNGTDRPLKILVIHENPLRPDRGGGEHRLLQVLRALRAQGHSVTYLAPRSFEKERYAHVVEELGIELFTDDAPVLRREGFDVMPHWTLQRVLRDGQFDLAIICLWFWMGISLPEHYLDEIRRFAPRTRIAVLSDDCHGLRETRAASLSQIFSDRERAEDYQEREADILRQADLVLAISDLDRLRIREALPRVDVETLPITVAKGPQGKAFESRGGLIYLADYTNPASLDGIEWYLKSVDPLVKKRLPDMKVHLVGTGLPDALGSADESVVRVGFAPDLAAEFAKRRILISPVRYGTGIKTKNLHAMAHGVPIVTTTIGGEGMNLTHAKNALIADSAEDFASAIIELHENREIWQEISQQGRNHILAEFSEQRLDNQLRAITKKIRSLTPKRYDSTHEWSVRRVEKYFPEVTTHHPPHERPALRVLAYIRSAEQLLATGDRAEARRQLRHVFSFVPNRVSSQQFFSGFAGMVENMERTYRDLGENEAAAAFRRETRTYVPWAFPESVALPTRLPKLTTQNSNKTFQDSATDFSVVIPSYNRSETLAQCLEALNQQSFSPRRFEVIVINDGSTDDTEALCRKLKPRYSLKYLTQQNEGAGAARRSGVAQARGTYVLLFNDDTIADAELLSTHWKIHQKHSRDKIAVLGDFRYPEAAKARALTNFLSIEPFLFPQVNLDAGLHSKNAYFIASNLSLRRNTLIEAGSFDPRFRVAEDTELGVRLRQRGYRVLYVPEARAIHQHVNFTMRDLIRRAEAYGKTQILLFETHPGLLGDGTGPFGKLDDEALRRIRRDVDQNGSQVRAAVESLEKFDTVDFLPFFSKKNGNRSAADDLMDLFKRALPLVFWYYLFAGFLAEWDRRSRPAPIAQREPVLDRK